MPNLKLTLPEDFDTIPFPARQEKEIASRHDESEPVDALEIARQLESALEDIQQRLDKVRDDLDAAYRFPGPEDWPPTAA